MKLPKLSELLNPVVNLETTIKSNIESATGLSLPPTPGEITKSVLEGIESTIPLGDDDANEEEYFSESIEKGNEVSSNTVQAPEEESKKRMKYYV